MSESITLPTNIEWGQNKETVDYITSQVNEVEKLWKSMIEKVATIGKVFAIVQQNSKDGTFQTWIESSSNTTSLSKPTVYLYIKVYRNYELVKDAKSLREALEMIGKKLENDTAPKKSTKSETNEHAAITSFRNAVEELKLDKKEELLEQMIKVCENIQEDIFVNLDTYKDIEYSEEQVKELKELRKSILSDIKKDEIKKTHPKYDTYKNLKKSINDLLLAQKEAINESLKELTEH